MPNLPLPGCLYDKVAAARGAGCVGVLAVWTMGLLPTLSSFGAGHLLANPGPLPPRDRWLRWLARAYFGEALHDPVIDSMLRAWDGFGRAIQNHPMESAFLYYSPMNYAPAYPWKR